MAIRGDTINVGINPHARKDLDPSETIAPVQMEARNGFVSDAGSWIKRPGYQTKWTTGQSQAVNALIGEGTGYAILANGKAYKLGNTLTELSTTIPLTVRPSWTTFDGNIIVATGDKLTKISGTTVTTISAAPSGIRFIGVINGKLVALGHDNTQIRWSDNGNVDTWSASNFTNTETTGDKIMNAMVLRESLIIFLENHYEIWDNTGSLISDTAIEFTRQNSVETGMAATDSMVAASASVYWLGDDGDFRFMENGLPKIISKPYRADLQKLQTINDCYGFNFVGERAIRWFFPTHGKCYRYDYVKDIFTEDNEWRNGCWERLPINSYMFLENREYIGDYNPTGLIYEWSKEFDADNDTPIRVFRRFQIPTSVTGNQARVNRVQFRVKREGPTGIINGSTSFIWRYRLDAGDWSDTRTFKLRGESQNPYLSEHRLGVGRQIEFEITETDAVEWVMTHVNLTLRDLGR